MKSLYIPNHNTHSERIALKQNATVNNFKKICFLFYKKKILNEMLRITIINYKKYKIPTSVE
jgi:hypothetical protein